MNLSLIGSSTFQLQLPFQLPPSREAQGLTRDMAEHITSHHAFTHHHGGREDLCNMGFGSWELMRYLSLILIDTTRLVSLRLTLWPVLQ